MKNAKNVEQQKENIIHMVGVLTATCDNKEEIRGLGWGLSLLEYIITHPHERGWQSLRNWNQIENPKHNFILTAEIDKSGDYLWVHERDTFYK